MAESPFKGLLYSPEVLGGIGLLTAGLSGQNPGAALPNLIQGMKTASMFSTCLLYTSPSPRDATLSRMPSSA